MFEPLFMSATTVECEVFAVAPGAPIPRLFFKLRAFEHFSARMKRESEELFPHCTDEDRSGGCGRMTGKSQVDVK
jgi:hypothetical protein